MKKKVRVFCHEPIALDPTFQQIWADTHITFKSRPGRTVRAYGPTLCSRTDLERDIMVSDSQAVLQGGEYLAVLKQTLRRLDEGERFVSPDVSGADEGVPAIYTAAEWIDRAEAERMLEFLMATLGYKDVRFQWSRPKFVFSPW